MSTDADQFEALRHWSIYGQKSEPSTRRVAAPERDQKTFQKPVTSPWDKSIPHAALTKLLNGFEPKQMEDKWFVYTDGPDVQGNAVVHMYRSWTGHKISELKVRMPLGDVGEFKEEDALITEITWESDPGVWQNADEELAKSTVKEVCNWVLDVQLKP